MAYACIPTDPADYLARRARLTARLAKFEQRIRKAARLGDEDGAEELNGAYLLTVQERAALDKAQRRAGR